LPPFTFGWAIEEDEAFLRIRKEFLIEGDEVLRG
jgi:hypothetical protein